MNHHNHRESRIENQVIYVPIRHYICRESSTNQLLFMQNKPNVKDAQINVNSYMKSIYEKLDNWLSGKNKPNSNPNKPNFKKAKMNANDFITKDYRKKDDFKVRINKANSKPISVKPKMSANLYFIEDYENETAFQPKKTNPNKPNFRKAKIVCRKIRPKFLVVGAYAMGAYSQIISVYNLIIFPFDLKISKWFIFGQLYWFCSMLPGWVWSFSACRAIG